MARGKLVTVSVKSYDDLMQRLDALKGNESLSVVHYSTAWTEEKTGTSRSEGQLATILENYENIANYIKGLLDQHPDTLCVRYKILTL
jgi:hypothetical protein